jgi:hypothetical protein
MLTARWQILFHFEEITNGCISVFKLGRSGRVLGIPEHFFEPAMTKFMDESAGISVTRGEPYNVIS